MEQSIVLQTEIIYFNNKESCRYTTGFFDGKIHYGDNHIFMVYYTSIFM